jgi:hypothetical protein
MSQVQVSIFQKNDRINKLIINKSKKQEPTD